LGLDLVTRAGPIAVWTLPLTLTPAELDASEATLSADERARAKRLPVARDRERFVAARGGLRTILGSLLGMMPAEVRFRYGPRGKPELDGAPDPVVHFNLSHSGDRALVAVSRSQQVGVDVEQVRPVPGLLPLVTRFFSDREREAIFGDEEPVEAFFYHWTLKEAWLKASGLGLGGPLRDIEVWHDAAGRPLMQRTAGPNDSVLWQLHSWRPAPDFVAALAAPLENPAIGLRGPGESYPTHSKNA
jgi:4'-phosphopantetheinyl transferase